MDALRREYQQTVDVYEDLCQCYQEEHGLHCLYVYAPIRLGELQVDSKKKSQLLYLIGQMLRAESMTYPMPYPLSNEQELFINKWVFRCYFKFELITKMPDGEEKENEVKCSGGLLKQTVLQECLVMR